MEEVAWWYCRATNILISGDVMCAKDSDLFEGKTLFKRKIADSSVQNPLTPANFSLFCDETELD